MTPPICAQIQVLSGKDRMPTHFGKRYVQADAFQREIKRLRLYRSHFGDSTLEWLERSRLVVPKLRVRYPDTISRRWWYEAHSAYGPLSGDFEPDGPRYEAALELENALSKVGSLLEHGRHAQPLDDLDPRFVEFVYNPAERPFVPWSEFRVDVSNETHKPFYHGSAVRTLYSSWQLLIVAEIAQMGLHYSMNLADEAIARRAWEAAHSSGHMPDHRAEFYVAPIRVTREFSQHENALNALVWFVEEAQNSLLRFTQARWGRRFRLDEAQSAQYRIDRDETARVAAAHYGIGCEEVLALCCFLAERWADWNHEGRHLVASEYKRYLGQAILMARILGELAYDDVRRHVDRQGGYIVPILDVIWPDWRAEENGRVRRYLEGMIQGSISPTLEITTADVSAFIEFIDQKNLHSFFWRLRSFEDHALRGNQFAVPGMRGDVQGMAVVVEHVMRALGGKKCQLYDIFKELWRANSKVFSQLKKNDRLARQAHQQWQAHMREINCLRQSNSAAERIVDDLVLAHRLRGAVHTELPEDDQEVLEDHFLTLMRAAARTFAHVRALTAETAANADMRSTTARP